MACAKNATYRLQLTTVCVCVPAPAVPLLEPHAAELEGLIAQLREAVRAMAAMVDGSVSLER